MLIRRALFLLLMFLPVGATAQTVFMVQLGTFETQEKAQSHWNELSKKFPNIFGGLKYTPDQFVKHPDNFINYRTQAGPIASREEAENICASIGQNGGGECYVAETAMFSGEDPEVATVALNSAPNAQAPAVVEDVQPAAAEANPVPPTANAQPVAAPVANKRTAASRQAPRTETAYVPRTPVLPAGYVPSAYATPQNPVTTPQNFVDPYAVRDTSPPQAYVPAAPVAVGEAAVGGTVAVQEAIPVPLSETTRNPYIERGNLLMNASPNDSSRVSSYWADISSFRNETAALRYVHLLKSRDNLLPRTLRIRITRPYGNIRERDQFLSLRMGPFVSTVPIRRICALTRTEKMRCRAVKDLGGSVQNTGRYNRLQSSRHNNQRSESPYLQYRRNARANSASPFNSSPNSYNKYASAASESYHVQLGSFLSPQAAEDKWRTLQAQHPFLKNVANQIISPNGSNGRLFRLRTAAVPDFVTANNLCNALKAGGTLCIVVK